ncbi:MAG: hypothetical protein AAGD14_02265 [Planctomycetota bacterium]
MSVRIAVTAPRLLFLLSLFVVGCGDDPAPGPAPVAQESSPPVAQPEPDTTAQPGTPATPKDPGLTDAIAAELGAAALVPADCAYFASSQRLAERWQALRDSNAVAQLMALPTVQMLLAQVMESPQWQQFHQAREQVPMVGTGVDVLTDAVSQEIFVSLDGSWPAFIEALFPLYLRAAFLEDEGGETALTHAAVASIVESGDALRLPGVLVGFRLQDPARATKLLKEVVAQFGPALPLPIAEEKIGGGTFHVLRVDATMLPPQPRAEMMRTLGQMGVPQERVERVSDWLDGQTAALALGVRGDYLLLSVGADTDGLVALGAEGSLAASEAFARVRGVCKPGVVGLSYLCAPFSTNQQVRVEEVQAVIDGMLDSEELAVPESLPARLSKDAEAFVADVNEWLPKAQSEISITFANRGLETYSFAARIPSMDASAPLPILAHAGPDPLLAVAGRSQPARRSWEQLMRWISVGYGYFEDYAVPTMSKGERADFRRFEQTLVPTMQRMRDITMQELLPSMDGQPSLFVLGAGGTLPMVPGVTGPLERPMRYPQPALVFGLNDAKQFRAAFGHYREAVNAMLAAMEEDNPDMRGTRWPAPATKEFEGAQLHGYAVPLPPAFGLMPNAVVTDTHAFASLSEAHAKQLMTRSAMPDGGVVDLTKPATLAVRADLAGLTGMLMDDVEILVGVMVEQGALDAQTAEMVALHLPALRTLLGTMKSYTSRTWTEGERAITHSWLHVEDAKK